MNDRLTEKDIKKMEEEIEHRKLVIRKEALEQVKEARAQGDLSENFEYYAAKKYKNQNESRIRYLERMIKTATIIEDDIYDAISMETCVNERKIVGGPAKETVKKAIENAKKELLKM